MKTIISACAVLAMSVAGATAALAQTASPSDRDTTLQTSGPNGTSGAVGPNDGPKGADKDGTTATTPPTRSNTHAHHHHNAKPANTTPPPGRG